MACQSFDTQNWGVRVCRDMGNLTPSQNTVRFIMGWEQAEGGGQTNNACFNALNMEDTHGAVMTFSDIASATSATSGRITGGLYPSLANALRTNDENNLGFNGHQIAQNIAGDLTEWVSGHRSPIRADYVNNILAAAGASKYQDITTAATDATSAIASTSAFIDKLNSLLSNPTRLVKGALGLVMILVGLAMLIKQMVPPAIIKAAGAAVGV